MSAATAGDGPSSPSGHTPRPVDVVAVASATAATFVVFSPANVYYANALELPLRFCEALPYLLLLTAATTLLIAGPICFLTAAWRGRAVSLLLGVAVAAWVQGNLLAWSYGRLDGRGIEWSASPWRGWVDGMTWLVVLVGVVLGWRIVSRHARDGAIALLAVQLVAAAILAYTNDGAPAYMLHRLDNDVAYRFSSKRNVVVLLLDGLQGTEFARVIADDPTLVSGFDGFRYFRDAVADFAITQASVPAILTGRRYDNSQSYTRFIEEAYDSRSSLPKRLREDGFVVDVFGLSKAIWTDPTVLSNLVAEPSGLEAMGGNLAYLVDLGLFRCLPHELKRVVYANGAWLTVRLAERLGTGRRKPLPIEGIFSNASFAEGLGGRALSLPLESAPAFKFFHIQGPHPPLSIDETGRPANLAFNPENYRRAVAGSIMVAGSLLALLRSRGLYDETMVFIISDHGGDVPVVLPKNLASEGQQDAARQPRGLPLMLAKPIGAHGALRVSDAPVQLSDMPKTVLSQLGIPCAGIPGVDIFSMREGERRERAHYSVVDTNWSAGRHLSAMTEYAVNGFGWYASSWQPTGRMLGTFREALETYRVLAGVPHLGALAARSSSGDDPLMIVSNKGELVAAFPPSVPDPARGDFVSVALPFGGLESGATYRLAFDCIDAYGADRPGRLMQLAWFDDRLIYANDLGAGTFTGPRSIEWQFRASSTRAELRLELRVIGEPEKGWKWGEVPGIALGGLRLEKVGSPDERQGAVGR